MGKILQVPVNKVDNSTPSFCNSFSKWQEGGVAMPTTNKGFLVPGEDLPCKNDRQDLCTFVRLFFLFFWGGGGVAFY